MSKELELEEIKQKLTEIEKSLSDIDFDKVSSKKGSKLKDRFTVSELEGVKQRISDIEELLGDIDLDDRISSKKGSKLKDR